MSNLKECVVNQVLKFLQKQCGQCDKDLIDEKYIVCEECSRLSFCKTCGDKVYNESYCPWC